jgi:hypothetical protein
VGHRSNRKKYLMHKNLGSSIFYKYSFHQKITFCVNFIDVFSEIEEYPLNIKNLHYFSSTVGVVQWSSHSPDEQKIRVRIPLGCKLFREFEMPLCYLTHVICILCVIY